MNIILGRPEWGQPDDEAVAEYAASLPTIEVVEEEALTLRQEWRAAVGYYWAAAYAAMTHGDMRLARESAKIATEATDRWCVDGVLKAAIFGGCQSRPNEKVVALGRQLASSDVAEARRAVTARLQPTAAPVRAKPSEPTRVAPTSDGQKAVLAAVLVRGSASEADLLADGCTAGAIRAALANSVVFKDRRGLVC